MSDKGSKLRHNVKSWRYVIRRRYVIHIIAIIFCFDKNHRLGSPICHADANNLMTVWKLQRSRSQLIPYAVGQLILSSRVKSVFLHITLKVGYNSRKSGMTLSGRN